MASPTRPARRPSSTADRLRRVDCRLGRPATTDLGAQRGKRIGIVVVAYNAASTLAKVLDRIPDEFVDRITGILVCDNASEDPTYLVGLGYQKTSTRGLCRSR